MRMSEPIPRTTEEEFTKVDSVVRDALQQCLRLGDPEAAGRWHETASKRGLPAPVLGLPDPPPPPQRRRGRRSAGPGS
jgi:hypothetical protein